MANEPQTIPPWISATLWTAAVYNLGWGVWAVVMPNSLFDWVGMARPNYPQLWQCIGMIVGVYGVGYAFAARDPVRHWPIVLVGFLGKLLGPIGLLYNVRAGVLPLAFGVTIITNDVIWLPPFVVILWHTRVSSCRKDQL